MSKLTVTHLIPMTGGEDEPVTPMITCTKGVRALTGWGLKAAREAVEDASLGHRVELELLPHWRLSEARVVAEEHHLATRPPTAAERLSERLRDLRRALQPEWIYTFRYTFWRNLPVYTTRQSAQGTTASLTFPAGLVLIAGVLVLANILLWSGIGIYEAISFIA